MLELSLCAPLTSCQSLLSGNTQTLEPFSCLHMPKLNIGNAETEGSISWYTYSVGAAPAFQLADMTDDTWANHSGAVFSAADGDT